MANEMRCRGRAWPYRRFVKRRDTPDPELHHRPTYAG